MGSNTASSGYQTGTSTLCSRDPRPHANAWHRNGDAGSGARLMRETLAITRYP